MFDIIYRDNLWLSPETRSGTGSTMAATAAIRSWLPAWMRERGCRSLLDIPCGDYHWMQSVDLGETVYIGADVVPEIIRDNQANHPDVDFRVLDVVRDDLPHCSVILCRDCLIHLPLADAVRAVSNMIRSAELVLISTVNCEGNVNCKLGECRPRNLCWPPFGLPPPIQIMPDDGDKLIGIWESHAIRRKDADRHLPRDVRGLRDRRRRMLAGG